MIPWLWTERDMRTIGRRYSSCLSFAHVNNRGRAIELPLQTVCERTLLPFSSGPCYTGGNICREAAPTKDTWSNA